MDTLSNFDINAQLIGFVAAALAFVVFQSNRRHRMLLLQVAANILWTIHFHLLGATTGSAINLTTSVRNSTYYLVGKNRNPLIPSLFGVAFIAITALAWEGPRSLLPLIGTLIGTIAFWQMKTNHIRLIALASPSLWLVYNVLSGSYAGIVSDVLVIASIALGIYRFDIKPFIRSERKKFRSKRKLKTA